MGYKLSPKPIRIMAALAVCSCIWLRGAFMLGNTHSRCPLIAFIESNTRKAYLLNGTLCGFFIFIKSDGMFHIELSVSISAHLARTASPGRTRVSNCHSISNRVSIRTEALFNTVRKRGVRLGAGLACSVSSAY